MRKLLLLLSIMILSTVASAQYTYQIVLRNAAAPNSGTSANIIGSGAAFHNLTWNVGGTVSTCSVRVDGSADGVTWGTGDVIGATTCTSNGNTISASHIVNYVRINLVTFTGTAPVFTANVSGYITQPSGGGTVTSVTCGTGLSGGTITSTGTCALANTAVTPASYTSANITVDQQGRITAASNGTGAVAPNSPTITPLAVSPAIPYNGMIFWFSADCITLTNASTCNVPANATNISYWVDRSGYYRNATNQSGTCTFNTAQLNSQPAVNFSSCHFDIAPAGLIPFNFEVTAFAVVKRSATTGEGEIVSGGSSSFVWGTVVHSGAYQGIARDNVATVGWGTVAIDATTWHQINVTCTYTSLAFRLDEATDTVASGTSCPGTFVNGYQAIGYDKQGANSFVGQIAEIITYNRLLSSTEITAVETYLHNKYGI